ncbi:MAG TPA: divalent-cation tolerance protein CutA [Pseudomonadales bacterium]|jgi:periplasmic divalent cation tolerance protein
MTEYCMILTTAGSAKEAAALADGLVAAALAACVQLMPVQSVYRWEGAVQHDSETLLLIKTRQVAFDAVAAYIHAHHRYSVPEIICLPITAGSSEYLGWIHHMTQQG